MARAGLTRERVVDLAVEVVDDGGVRGFDDLTLAAVAGRAGVAVPSLYKHVGSLEDLRCGIALRCVSELREVLVTAALGRAGSDALRSLARAYRSFAQQHPGRYLATQVRYTEASSTEDGAALGLTGGFGLPTDVDDSFEFLITTLDAGIRSALAPG
jgi:AcrR family transcriptional regulator